VNPLLRDEDVSFLLYDVLDVESLTKLPYFADHGRETFDPYLASVARFAREVAFPTYRTMDQSPPRFENGRVLVHPLAKEHHPRLVELGIQNATRPAAVGGQQLPSCIHAVASAYLAAGNLGLTGFLPLASGAGHLIEAFGTEDLKKRFMEPLYEGRWGGTMALTEPHAGSSLADVRTKATPAGDGSYRISGSKIFISGGDQDVTENIVHLTLARIEGAPAGIKGVSLFAIPKKRDDGSDNDVSVAGVIHKIGWRGLPSLAINFGERGDCRGWLVGEPNRGINQMFQMMNEARIAVGVAGVATASVAYHEARAYAEARPQGRTYATARDPESPQVAIIEHADVRRMLLRQKAIVEGGLCLVLRTAVQADLAEHATEGTVRERAKLLLDLLTPIAKSFPAEYGFEANVLALQIHGGYGYSSEYLPEAWLRDQKLNSIHEGTTGIQSLDLLGRKVVAQGGAALRALGEDVRASCARAKDGAIALAKDVERGIAKLEELTMMLGAKGLGGDVEGMLAHSVDYLTLASIVVVAWQHLDMANAVEGRDDAFARGKRLAAEYWIKTEIPHALQLADLCASGEDSFVRVRPGEL
jgi:alkylation response protein AidB-like acyl-CoA dehydrogenase